MTVELLELLKQGKKVYVGYCLNAHVNEKPMEFENDNEAISILSDYEAEVYKFYLEDGEIRIKFLYDPFDYDG